MNADTGLFVHLGFRLLARLFPFVPPDGKKGVTAAQLRPQFKGWEARVLVLFLVFSPVAIWICNQGFRAVFRLPARPGNALFHVTADPAFFLLPALFVGLVLVALPVMGVVRLALGERFADYLLYGNLLVGFDTVKVWLWLSALLTAAALVAAGGASAMHFTIYGDRIEIRHFGALRDTIVPYSEVSALEQHGSGNVTLKFSNGTSWSSDDDLSLISLSDSAVSELRRRTSPTLPPTVH